MRKYFSSLLFVLVVGGAATGCMASGSARYSASATMPSMVYISPGVQVIEDYEEPVFYSSNVYWRWNAGVWYQSRTYTGGWVRATPPTAIVSIQQPSMYVRYRASARGGARSQPASVQQERREDRQEHREDKREAQEERREDKQERREEKAEEKQERREEKREDQQERREDKQERREDKQDHKKGHKK